MSFIRGGNSFFTDTKTNKLLLLYKWSYLVKDLFQEYKIK